MQPSPALKGAKRLLVITDKGVMGLGLLNAALNGLQADGYAVHVYDKVVADPPESVLFEAVEEGEAFGAEAVIGFGGGSPMDTAKVVALMLGGPQKLADMYGMDQATGPRLPLVLIPTTAGTGSEVTSVAVITTGATSKRGSAAAPLYADMAILDADLTIGLPRHITRAATGIECDGPRHRGLYRQALQEPCVRRAGTRRDEEAAWRAGAGLSGRVGSRKAGPTCCWARCWRVRPSPTRLWVGCTPWPIRWGGMLPRAARAVQLGRPAAGSAPSTPVRQKISMARSPAISA